MPESTLDSDPHTHADAIMESIRDPLLVLDGGLRVRAAMRSFYEAFQTTPQQTLGRSLFELGNGQWNVPALWKLLDERLLTTGEFNDCKIEHDFPGIGRRTMLLNARRLHDSDKDNTLILLAIEDITERCKAEDQLAVSEIRYRRLFEAARDGILILSKNTLRITDVNPFMLELLGYPRAHFIGKELWEIGIFRDKDASQSAMDKLLENGFIRFEDLPLKDRNGKLHPVEIVANVYQENDTPVIQCNIRDIGERVGFERERAALQAVEHSSRMEAQRASAAKDRFLATLSHELRTPLTPVLATLSTWEVSADLPEAMRRDAQMLRRNIELEARLIDDLLDVTRIMKGKLSLNRELTDLNDILTSVAGIVRSDMQAKHIHFTLQLNAQSHFVNGDPARLHQVVWNLLKNAAKFTPEKGSITLVTANEADGSVTLTITDSGTGIPPDLIERIFEPFEQGDGPFIQHFGGLGLGLAIAKALVIAHGGSINASSEGTNKGATFVVRLPTIEAPEKTQTPGPFPPPHVAGKSLSILLVEDHADSAMVMGRLLTKIGHQVQIAHTVTKALSLAQQHSFDLLLSDIGLPDGNGIDLLGKLRALGPIPAIALTGYGMDEDIAQCRAAGFRAHLTKPVNFRKLQEVLVEFAESLPEVNLV